MRLLHAPTFFDLPHSTILSMLWEGIEIKASIRLMPYLSITWLIIMTQLLLAIGQLGDRFFSDCPQLAATLEARFSRPFASDINNAVGLIVLGGGEARLLEAARLARENPHLKLFVSGAGDIGDIRAGLGGDIEPTRIMFESKSQTTFENAKETRRSLEGLEKAKWLLVTSAIHMPRAIGTFRTTGINLIPWPVYDLDDEDRVERIVRALHEWIGLIYYRFRGYTSNIIISP